MSASDRRPLVCLRESETVVPHGHRKIIWFIRDNDRWRPAATWPGATVSEESPGPGTIWVRTIEVRLSVGHCLMCIDSRPAQHPSRDVLDYLRRETRLAERETRRDYVSVGPGGHLAHRETTRPQTQQGSGPMRR